MLESILNFKEISKNPHLAFIWAFIVTSVAIFISIELSWEIMVGSYRLSLVGIFSVIFTIIPLVYLITYALKKEEKIEEEEIRQHLEERNMLGRHMYDILFFLFVFLGITMAYALWAFLLPESIFQIQLMKINELQSVVSGNFIMEQGSQLIDTMFTGYATANPSVDFFSILFNNIKVTIFAFVFSLLYGAGAVFIIVWNASILGVYIGYLSKSITHLPLVALSFLPHGLPEIIGYLFAGMSGGILSASLIRKHSMKVTEKIFFDCLILLCVGTLFIIVAAYVEAFL